MQCSVAQLPRLLCEWLALLMVGFAAGYGTHAWRAAAPAGAPIQDCRPSQPMALTSTNLAHVRERLGRELAHLRVRERELENTIKAAEVARRLLRDRGYDLHSQAYQQNEERHSQALTELDDLRREIVQVAQIDERIQVQLRGAAELEAQGADAAVVQEALHMVIRLEARHERRGANLPLAAGAAASRNSADAGPAEIGTSEGP